MRCNEVRNMILEVWPEEVPPPVREHMRGCPACAAFVGDYGLVREGFRALALEVAPDPSWGFAERLLRRLEELREPQVAEFLERAGKRVVYATGLLALTLMLALLLPSSGPLRGPTTAELYLAEQEMVAPGNAPIFTGDASEAYEAAPLPLANGGEDQKR